MSDDQRIGTIDRLLLGRAGQIEDVRDSVQYTDEYLRRLMHKRAQLVEDLKLAFVAQGRAACVEDVDMNVLERMIEWVWPVLFSSLISQRLSNGQDKRPSQLHGRRPVDVGQSTTNALGGDEHGRIEAKAAERLG